MQDQKWERACNTHWASSQLSVIRSSTFQIICATNVKPATLHPAWVLAEAHHHTNLSCKTVPGLATTHTPSSGARNHKFCQTKVDSVKKQLRLLLTVFPDQERHDRQRAAVTPHRFPSETAQTQLGFRPAAADFMWRQLKRSPACRIMGGLLGQVNTIHMHGSSLDIWPNKLSYRELRRRHWNSSSKKPGQFLEQSMGAEWKGQNVTGDITSEAFTL